MRVKRDSWDGDLRRVHEIAELRDVSIVTAPAYPAAAVEYRSINPAPAEEDTTMADMAEQQDTTTAPVEDRAEPPVGGLQVEDRVSVTQDPPRGLADEFRSRGFPARPRRSRGRHSSLAP